MSSASVADHGPSGLATPAPPAEAAAVTSVQQPIETATDAGPDYAPTPADEVPPAPEPPTGVATVPLHDGAAGSPRGRGLAWAAVLVAAGIAVYFAYGYFQRFQPSDAAPRPAASEVAKERAASAPPDKPTAAGSTAVTPSDPAKPVAGADAGPAAATPERGTAAVGQAKVTVGDGGGGKGGQGTPAGTGSARPQPPTDIFVAKPDSDPRRTAPAAQETTKAAAASTQGEVRRAASSDGRGAAQRAPGSAACTDAVAALGLCTQENTQGRKP